MGEIPGDYFRREGVKIHRTPIEITPHILGVEKKNQFCNHRIQLYAAILNTD